MKVSSISIAQPLKHGVQRSKQTVNVTKETSPQFKGAKNAAGLAMFGALLGFFVGGPGGALLGGAIGGGLGAGTEDVGDSDKFGQRNDGYERGADDALGVS